MNQKIRNFVKQIRNILCCKRNQYHVVTIVKYLSDMKGGTYPVNIKEKSSQVDL